MRQLKIKLTSSRAFDVSVESSRGVIEVKGKGKGKLFYSHKSSCHKD